MNNGNPVLVLVRGLPGSGKSYIVDRLTRQLSDQKTTVLDPDATDYDSVEYQQFSAQCSEEGVDPKFHPYRFLRAQAYNGILNNHLVIWNQAFTHLDGFQKTVINLTSFAEENNKDLAVLVVEVNTDPEVAKNRIADRVARGGHDVPKERFEQFIAEYRSFKEEGYNTVAVSGEEDPNNSCKKIIEALEKL